MAESPRKGGLGWTLALVVLAVLAYAGFQLHDHPEYGREGSFTLIAGAVFGVLLQRSRFCFFCILREFLEERDSRALFGILAALVVGSVGYQVVFGSWIADPAAGHLPPDAHIGPVGWHLLLGGLAFGLGMALSGSCISAHLYRLGEGSLLAPIALIGACVGFGLGFLTWNWFYLTVVATAPVVWLPARFGYIGSLTLQLGLLAVLAVALIRLLPAKPASAGGKLSLSRVTRAVLVDRWPTWIGGLGVGILGTFAYLRTQPLGVTAELGRISRRISDRFGLLPERLEGLDGFAGCSTQVTERFLSDNGIFVLALVLGAFAAALGAGRFRPRLDRPAAFPLAFTGGVLLGFGAMISLGCTIGTLLSGIMAFALSGWIFVTGLLPGLWLGLRIRRRLLPRRERDVSATRSGG